jgi:hypothetical protein
VSAKDNLWAVETPVPKGAESPLDVLLPAHGDDAAAERFWERLRAEGASRATPRKLGEANALVAHSLLLSESGLLEGEGKAAAELQATGWVAWVDRCLPGVVPPRLPAALIELPRTAPLRPWIEVLSAGLTERAAEAAQERSLSQQSQQLRALAFILGVWR